MAGTALNTFETQNLDPNYCELALRLSDRVSDGLGKIVNANACEQTDQRTGAAGERSGLCLAIVRVSATSSCNFARVNRYEEEKHHILRGWDCWNASCAVHVQADARILGER